MHLITEAEYTIENCNNFNIKTKNSIRAKVINIFTNYVYKLKNSSKQLQIVKDFIIAIRFLKTNNNIVITTSDKGNRYGILRIDDYERNMFNLLKDSSTYVVLKSNRNNKFQNRKYKLIDEL